MLYMYKRFKIFYYILDTNVKYSTKLLNMTVTKLKNKNIFYSPDYFKSVFENIYICSAKLRTLRFDMIFHQKLSSKWKISVFLLKNCVFWHKNNTILNHSTQNFKHKLLIARPISSSRFHDYSPI